MLLFDCKVSILYCTCIHWQHDVGTYTHTLVDGRPAINACGRRVGRSVDPLSQSDPASASTVFLWNLRSNVIIIIIIIIIIND